MVHPTVMGTDVYLDDGAQPVTGEPQRFHDHYAWVSWHDATDGSDKERPCYNVECIDAYTGVLADSSDISALSSSRLLHALPKASRPTQTMGLADLRAWKRQLSPLYEARKDNLLSRHPVFRDWCRREYNLESHPGPTTTQAT